MVASGLARLNFIGVFALLLSPVDGANVSRIPSTSAVQ